MSDYDSSYKHFILYAKYHYVRNNIIDDLKVLMSEYSGVEFEHIMTKDIFIVINEIVWKYYIYGQEYFYNKVTSFLFGKLFNYYRFGDDGDELFYEVFEKMLSFIADIPVNRFPFELGEPDNSILEIK